MADLPLPRPGIEGLGRRRQRVHRLPQRLRLDGAGSRPPRDLARRAGAVAKGTHFAAPTEDGILVSEELARRFGLPQWRYVNSGSEATMDAIRIARGLTGRDTIVKIFGSYHGHHDYAMVSIGVPYDEDRRPGELRFVAVRRRASQGRHRYDDRRAVQRCRRDGAADRTADRGRAQARLRDHGSRDDEPGRDPAGARISRGDARADQASTASC